MVRTRQAKVDGIAATIPPLEVDDPDGDARVLVLGWGSTYGPIGAAVPAGARAPAARSRRPTCATSTRSRPTSATVLRRYDKVVVPEMNLGQLALLIRGRVPGRRDRLQPGARAAVQGRGARRGHHDVHRRRRNRGHRMTEYRSLDLVPKARRARSRPRTSRPTRRCAGAPAAVTTRSSPRCSVHARARPAAGEHRVRLRHRLLVAVPVLHEHLRDALDPRPRAGDRDRAGGVPAGPVGVGGHRRRRRAVDRRQPPDPRAAPQRQPQDPAVQQPDLRADQGPVLPDLRARQDHQVDADGLAGLRRSTRCRWRSAPRRRSWPARSTPTAST